MTTFDTRVGSDVNLQCLAQIRILQEYYQQLSVNHPEEFVTGQTTIM